ncbi:MAG TPA: DUF6622 family protein [Noviherbaspirillum sp.]|jgi:hypothetical protein|uniref:DUF6622 family protein n=1 Tax=Noviherbaspirillum sp. TaxID=1926288 RepID=UPI002DDCC967|nr:DUF6622 family protein [Noviherbaspirillum sp.]HEV2608686.1 DUF6622 family protein [Noviherbaspirillum sp.]
MAATIFSQAPVWVWPVLVALIVLGVQQSRTRHQSLRRGIVLPAVMTAVSLVGVISASGASVGAILVWTIGLAVATGLASKLGIWRGISWSDSQQRLSVPGSWFPLALFLGIFAVKFLAGMALATVPELRDAAHFVMATSLIYGAFTGLFVARGIAMWLATSRCGIPGYKTSVR